MMSACGPLRTVASRVPRRLALALARVAAGGARRGLMLARSGAERADYPVVLGPGSGRITHCAPCGRSVQTDAARMRTKCAARTDPGSALRGAPEIAPAGLRLPRRWVCGVRGVGLRAPIPGPDIAHTMGSAAEACGDPVQRASGALRRTGLAPSAQRVRHHAHRHCLSVVSAANAASLAMRAQDRAPQGSRRVQRPTAPVKRCTGSPQALAAPRPTHNDRPQRAESSR